jgi:organic hydroperoxide reductase OsmC/OhrA
VEPQAVAADAVAHIVRNEAGRFRVGSIDVELSVAVSESDQARLDRCDTLFEDFCIVTESIRHGVPVAVRVKTPQIDAVTASHSQ